MSVLPGRIRLLAQRLSTVALDLLFPPHCVHCDRVGSLVCPRCLATIIPAVSRSLPEFDDVRVYAEYRDAIAAAVQALKYKRQTRLAHVLGGLLSRALDGAGWPVDLVTAVPLHASRLAERGYNQAALLGAVVAQQNGWPFAGRAIRRVRETPSQVHLSAAERQVNVAGAFEADPLIVRDRAVLLIDDVLTTGATMTACAEALRAAGAAQIYAAALAGAVYSHDTAAGAPDAPV
ncbi:MAG: ComF family protein [Chloroflexi bacterium]|nr:ComF family protein [Chloroflexota bacterium]